MFLASILPCKTKPNHDACIPGGKTVCLFVHCIVPCETFNKDLNSFLVKPRKKWDFFCAFSINVVKKPSLTAPSAGSNAKSAANRFVRAEADSCFTALLIALSNSRKSTSPSPSRSNTFINSWNSFLEGEKPKDSKPVLNSSGETTPSPDSSI